MQEYSLGDFLSSSKLTGSTGTPFLAVAGATGAWKNKRIKAIIMNNNNSKKNV